ncbi:MAG: cupin domain-containing protein [Phycisphaerae bacterium]|nr:cupin domain-containing protein [Phycisphaerae bacterium]
MTIEAFVTELAENSEYQSLFKAPATCGMHAGRVYLKGGDECGRHSTHDREEMLVFLSGKGLAVIGENKTLEVGQGKVLYIPPQTLHNIKNMADEPLSYIFCVVPVNSNGGNENVGH